MFILSCKIGRELMHKLFQLVPDIQKQEYGKYIKLSDEKKVQIDQYCWNYRIFNDYGSWIIFLPGFRFRSSVFYQYLLRLSRRFRILALDLPHINNIQDILSGLKHILTKENITSATVIGFHDFGFLAPVIAKEFPAICKKLIFADTIFNSSSMPRVLRENLLSSIYKNNKSLKYSLKSSLAKKIERSWAGVSEKIIGEELFWKTYFRAESLAHLRENESCFLEIKKDYLLNYVLDADDFKDIRCLFFDIFEENNKTGYEISIAVRDFFRNLTIIEEQNAAKSALLSKKTSYINIIEDFIKGTTHDK